MICAAMLAAMLIAVPSLDATAAAPERYGEHAARASLGSQYRAAYTDWRERLQQHDLFVGRDLLPRVRSAASATSSPTKDELQRSIWRMQERWGRWLKTTDEGRGVAFKLKVRRRVPDWGKAHLRSIAACESHNNPRAVGGGGTYRGLYQFSFSTWSIVGGQGDPAAASRGEQTWRAWKLLSRHGAGHWPVCG